MCFPACLPAASSTTGPDHLKQDKDSSATDASSWSVDDVIRFVQEADPQTLGPHIDLFRKHVSTAGCVVTHLCGVHVETLPLPGLKMLSSPVWVYTLVGWMWN